MEDKKEISSKVFDKTDLIRLKEEWDGMNTVLDKEKDLSINIGIPTKDNIINVPIKPHVFLAEVHAKDSLHPNDIVLNDTCILLAHGVRNKEDKWVFFEGQPVIDTVNSYNEYALKKNFPMIEFVITCNDDPKSQGTDIQYHEFGISSSIAHAAGENITVNTFLEKNGLPKIYVRTNQKILNLDSLITSKDVNVTDI